MKLALIESLTSWLAHRASCKVRYRTDHQAKAAENAPGKSRQLAQLVYVAQLDFATSINHP